MSILSLTGKAGNKVALVISIGAVILTQPVAAGAAEISVLSLGAMSPVLRELTADFERASGHRLVIRYAPAGAVKKQIQSGEKADVTFMPQPAMADLVKEGKVESASVAIVARSLVGVAVRSGAPKPDISSVEALKRSLLAAKSVAYVDPATGAASGTHFAGVLQRLGIAEEIKPRIKLISGSGGGVVVLGDYIAKGDAEIGVQQMSELLSAKGVDVVGPLPAELQNTTDFVFSAGVVVGAKEPSAGNALINFLLTPASKNAIKAKGMEPG